MKNQIVTYYIPNNPNIPKGHIYTLYLNNITNLDLTSLQNTKTISANTPLNKSTITISQQDYTRLLELNNLADQLMNERTTDIQKFIEKESQTTKELTKLNIERQELIKKLSQRKDV